MKTFFLRIAIVAVCVIGVASCGTKQTEEPVVPVVRVDLDMAALSEEEAGQIFTDPSYVVLRGVLLGQIEQILDWGDRYVIYDQKQEKVYLFDTLGQLICPVGAQGKGPHEYVQLGGIGLNGEELVLGSILPHRLMFFDKNGNFLRDEPTESVVFNKGIACSGGKIYGVSSCNRGESGYTVRRIDSGLDTPYLPRENCPASIAGGAYQSVADSGIIWISRPFDNRVYRIDPQNNGPEPVFEFDFGNGNIPESYTDGINDVEVIMNARKENKVFHAARPCQIGQQLMVGTGGNYLLVDLTDGEVRRIQDIPVCEGLTINPWGYVPLAYQHRRIAMQVDPLYANEDIEKGHISHSSTLDSLMSANSEYQNPILVVFNVADPNHHEN